MFGIFLIGKLPNYVIFLQELKVVVISLACAFFF